MLVLNATITKPYWGETLKYIVAKIKRREYELFAEVHPLKIIRINDNNKHILYVAVSDQGISANFKELLIPMGWLYLVRKPNWAALEVTQTFVAKPYRGKNLGTLLYKCAIDSDEVILMSGKKQTPFAQELWKSFVRDDLFSVFAVNLRTPNVASSVQYDADLHELECDLQLYKQINDRAPGDVRLVAIRKD